MAKRKTKRTSKRRGLGGLSSSPQRHMASARAEALEAKKAADRAQSTLSCAVAIVAAVDAAYAAGRATAHGSSQSSKEGRAFADAARESSNGAVEAARRKCIPSYDR